MSDPVVMELDDAAHLNLTEPQIRESVWLQHSSATYEQLYSEDKPGVMLVHKPSDKHHEHDQKWILEDDEADGDEWVMPAFQGCLFEDGSEVPGRYHGVPETSQTRFLGFNAIYETCHRWFRPWTSSKASFRFNEALRQYADLYPLFRTPQFYIHVLKVSNVLYHPFALFAKPGEEGIAKIPIIWQTPWLRQNISQHSMEAWLLDGVWPMLNCGKIQLNLQLYYMRSKEYMVALSATKRPRNMVHTGGLHRLTVRVCNLGLLKNHPIKGITAKREKKSDDVKEEKNSYKGARTSAIDIASLAALAHQEYSNFSFNDSSETIASDSAATSVNFTADSSVAGKYNGMPVEAAHRLLETRDNMIASTQNELAAVNLKLTEAQSKLNDAQKEFTEKVVKMAVKQKTTDVMLNEAITVNTDLGNKINDLDITLANQTDSHAAEITEMKRLATETDQTTNYQLDHLMKENATFKERNAKLQGEYSSLEKSCDGWEDQIKRIESQRDSARLDLSALQTKLNAGGWEDQFKEMKTQRDSAHTDLKSLQQKMDTDTKVIEKGISDSEVKYNNLRRLYKDLETSCDKDLHNFQSELQNIKQPAYSGGVALEQLMDKVSKLEGQLRDASAKLLEWNALEGLVSEEGPRPRQNSSSLDNSKPMGSRLTSSALDKSAADVNNDGEQIDYETNYSFGGHSNPTSLLTINETTSTLDSCVKHMDATIEKLRADTTLNKNQKSDRYFQTCLHDIQLTHEIMADWAQKTIAFPVPKSQMRLMGQKNRQKCVCCGKEEGGWDGLHNRGDPITGARICPHKGVNCSICKRYGLLTLDSDERYINHSADICPLSNMPFFTDRLVSHLLDKHGPDLKATSQLSAFD
jgi:predicted  nucleic acid-binding Zn-ribbon protein